MTFQFAPNHRPKRIILLHHGWRHGILILPSLLTIIQFVPQSLYVAYQRIITSASMQYPLTAWLNYDIQFRTLAASDPSLRWDTRHTDLWLQCVTTPSLPTIRWPCSHCGATNHFSRNCPFRPHAIPAPTDGRRQANMSSSSSGQHTVTGGAPNFRQPTYHAFNHSVCCRQTCQFLHQCELCGANHSAKNCAKNCPNRGSSTQ